MKLTPLRARMLKVPSPKYTASAPASIAACRQVKSPAGASISGFLISEDYTKTPGSEIENPVIAEAAVADKITTLDDKRLAVKANQQSFAPIDMDLVWLVTRAQG